MTAENLLMFDPVELPQTDEPKKKPKINILQDMLLELMDERKVSLAQIQKATGIPWGTLQGWHDGDVGCQKLDRNVFELAKFFNVHLHYLGFGVGTDEPAFRE